MSKIYGASTIKRRRRTKAQDEQLCRQIVTEVEQDHPQSVRHVFYRMTDPRLSEPVEKSDRGYRHVQNRVVKLRRGDRIPYSWITDTSRRGYFTQTYQDGGEFIRRMAGLYRGDLWQQSDFQCEVWCESRSIAGVIQNLCEELAVSLYPTGGFSSITLAFSAAEFINAYADGRPIKIFFIGDYDPAGVLIDVAVERELREHLDPEIELDFVRLGITPEQIAEYDLPTKPRKSSDRRSLHIESTVEAEAMPAHILRSLLRDRIEALLPPDALRVTKIAEASERQHINLVANLLGDGVGL